MSSFEEPLKVAKLMAGFKKPWFIAGGWATDLYLGQVTRVHEDIEIAILRCDQLELQSYLRDWEFKKVIPGPEMRTEPWNESEWLDLPVHEIHGRKAAGDPLNLEILLNESSGEEWRFRRNLKIVRPLSMIGLRSENGIPFLSPEVVLLYKAKNPTNNDQADLNNVRKVLDGKRRQWLKQAIQACHPGHPWINLL